MPISFFRRVSRFWGFSVHLALQQGNPSVYWGATLSCPLMASNYANLYLVPISFWSRSGCWAFLGFFLSYLVLQACILFCSVSGKSGVSMFMPGLHKNAAAHIFFLSLSLFLDIQSESQKKIWINTQSNSSSPRYFVRFCSSEGN